jgi:hypothetical protein
MLNKTKAIARLEESGDSQGYPARIRGVEERRLRVRLAESASSASSCSNLKNAGGLID